MGTGIPVTDPGSADGPAAPCWEPRHSPPPLPPAAVHVWYADLDLDPAERERLGRVLSPEERARADRVRVPGCAAAFRAARGVLRNLLGAYLERPPSAVSLWRRPGGKPDLGATAGSDLRFNLSHSGDHALLAITRGTEVGVDIECARPIPDLDRLARRVLTPAERRALAGLPADRRARAFLRCWTRKEAYAKARGTGVFRVGVGRLELGGVEAEPGWRSVHDPRDGTSWSVRSLDPPPTACVAALAIECTSTRLRCLTWRPRA